MSPDHQAGGCLKQLEPRLSVEVSPEQEGQQGLERALGTRMHLVLHSKVELLGASVVQGRVVASSGALDLEGWFYSCLLPSVVPDP